MERLASSESIRRQLLSYSRELMTTLREQLMRRYLYKRLVLRSSKLANRLQQGIHRSIFKGTGVDFIEVREYLFGDDPRFIDWNVSARYNQLFVREFSEEKEFPLMFVLHMHGGDLFGSRGKTKLEIMLEVILWLSKIALLCSEKIGLWLIVPSLRRPIYLPPLKGLRQLNLIVQKIVEVVRELSDGEVGSELPAGLELYYKSFRRRTMVMVISDLWGTDPEKLDRALRKVSFIHDISLIRVTDPVEWELPNLGIVEFWDPFLGERVVVDTTDKNVRRAYTEYVQRFDKLIKGIVRKLDIEFWDILTVDDISYKLTGYLKRREHKVVR